MGAMVVGAALLSSAGFAYAQTGTGTTATPPPVTTTTTAAPKPAFDVACVQGAIEKRDTAIIGGVDAFGAAIKSALTTRKDALKAAWAVEKAKDRRTARKAAWAAYDKAAKDAHSALKTVRNGAWSTYKTDLKACKATDAGEGVDRTSSATNL